MEVIIKSIKLQDCEEYFNGLGERIFCGTEAIIDAVITKNSMTIEGKICFKVDKEGFKEKSVSEIEEHIKKRFS